jgi:hypothetical protein
MGRLYPTKTAHYPLERKPGRSLSPSTHRTLWKYCTCQEMNHDSSVVWPIASSLYWLAIPAPSRELRITGINWEGQGGAGRWTSLCFRAEVGVISRVREFGCLQSGPAQLWPLRTFTETTNRLGLGNVYRVQRNRERQVKKMCNSVTVNRHMFEHGRKKRRTTEKRNQVNKRGFLKKIN